jgi:hypothetical protein
MKDLSLRPLALAAMLGLSTLALAACGDDDVAENDLGDRIERNAEDAAERTGEAMQDLGNAIEERAEDAGDAIERRVE